MTPKELREIAEKEFKEVERIDSMHDTARGTSYRIQKSIAASLLYLVKMKYLEVEMDYLEKIWK